MPGKLPFERKKPEVVIRKDAQTDAAFGYKPEDRPTEMLVRYGIVNVDKPKGPTSHQVSEFVQRILGLKKAGHSGTLDPAVTGVLPTALGKGTRVVQALLSAGKEYVCVMHLHQEVSEEKIREVASKKFTGVIDQLPPIKSAVKRQQRKREIYYLEVLEVKGQDVLFRVGCEAGTYIRKLVHDMGQELGVGAHMAELRRTKAGPFDESTLTTLQDLADAYHYWKEKGDDAELRERILPLETGVSHVRKVWVFDQTVPSMCHGSDLKVPGVARLHAGISKGEIVAVMTLKDELIALGEARMTSDELLLAERGVAVSVDKVFMEAGTYAASAKN